MWWCMNEAIRMQLSAFVDGELPENEAELLLRRLSQDAELRQQVAEFMAIGRAMRGEVQVGGIDDLRDRVATAIDAAPSSEDHVEDVPVDDRLVRPMAGFAIAATVALVAIFGLGQMSGVEGVVEGGAGGAGVADVDVDLRRTAHVEDVADEGVHAHGADAGGRQHVVEGVSYCVRGHFNGAGVGVRCLGDS